LAQKILQRSLQSLEKLLRREDDCMLRSDRKNSVRIGWKRERSIELALLIYIRDKRPIHQLAKLDGHRRLDESSCANLKILEASR
jgi:hypothetical protein